MKILLIEDDDRIVQPLAEDLRQQHHAVDLAADGLTGWDYAQSTRYDLILLDLMLPKLDGITLCRQLRAAGCAAYVLMLTARDTTSDKVLGLDAGADDYLVKPFELEELEARIRALSRRYPIVQSPVLQHEYLQLDPSTRQVTYQGTRLSLTPREYMILDCLLRQPTQVFTRSMLMDKLWDYDQTVGEETIKTHLVNLRRKLKAAGSVQELIETVYGVGYRLRPI